MIITRRSDLNINMPKLTTSRGSSRNHAQTTVEKLKNRFPLDYVEVLDDWSLTRQRVSLIMKSRIFQIGVPALITFSFVLAVLDVELRARGVEIPLWVGIVEKTMLLLFALELAMRLYVKRSTFFLNHWNNADLAVVTVDLIFSVFQWVLAARKDGPSLSLLRIFRVGRMMRMSKVLVDIRELYVIIYGLVSAFKAIFYGSCLIICAFLIFSIVTVEVVHPLNQMIAEEGIYEAAGCARCPHAFENIGNSCLTFLQTIVAGDSWGEVAVPIIERHPWTAIIFFVLLATVQMGLMNLVLMVIVDTATDARNEDIVLHNEERAEHYKLMRETMMKVCLDIDTDQNGTITLDEMLRGAVEDKDFEAMLLSMDINHDELTAVFNILDVHRSGSISHHDFVETFFKLKTGDSHTLLMLLKYDVLSMKDRFVEHIASLHAKLEENHSKLFDMIQGNQGKVAPAINEGNCLPSGVPPVCANSIDIDLCIGACPVYRPPDLVELIRQAPHQEPQPGHLVMELSQTCAQIQQELQRHSEQINMELESAVLAAARIKDNMGTTQEIRNTSQNFSTEKIPASAFQRRQGCEEDYERRKQAEDYSTKPTEELQKQTVQTNGCQTGEGVATDVFYRRTPDIRAL